MNNTIDYYKYTRYIERKIPCIMYFLNFSEPSNHKLIEKMDHLCSYYRYVLCFKVNWQDCFRYDKIDQLRSSSEAICFKEKKIICYVSIFDDKKLHNLFKTVHNDCVMNYGKCFNRILRKHQRINIVHRHKLYLLDSPSYKLFDIDLTNKDYIEEQNKEKMQNIIAYGKNFNQDIDVNQGNNQKIKMISKYGQKYNICITSANDKECSIKNEKSVNTCLKSTPINDIDLKMQAPNISNTNKMQNELFRFHKKIENKSSQISDSCNSQKKIKHIILSRVPLKNTSYSNQRCSPRTPTSPFPIDLSINANIDLQSSSFGMKFPVSCEPIKTSLNAFSNIYQQNNQLNGCETSNQHSSSSFSMNRNEYICTQYDNSKYVLNSREVDNQFCLPSTSKYKNDVITTNMAKESIIIKKHDTEWGKVSIANLSSVFADKGQSIQQITSTKDHTSLDCNVSSYNVN